MNLKKTKLFILGLCLIGLFGINHKVEAASLNFAVNTITGTVYHDLNENGTMELSNFEVGISKQQVSLYGSLSDAVNDENVLQTTTTGSLGTFKFTKLKRNTYYVRYNFNSDYRPVAFEKNAISDNQEQLKGIAKVDVTNKKTWFYTANLPLKRVASLEILPFLDANWNGTMDEDESIMDGKTMIIVNLRRLPEILESGELSTLDTTSLLSNALNGNIDIADAIYIRTTQNGQLINLPDVSSDFYVILRSPFNLTFSGLLENKAKLAAILEIIKGGDMTTILDNPELISTGDIDTNSDNDYIKLLASTFPKLADEVDKINYSEVIGENNSMTITKTTTQLRAMGELIDNIPAMRFVKVDAYGKSYDLTGLKFKETNQFFFGIQRYATITGVVFSDKNINGWKDTFEPSTSVELTAYDEAGNVLKTIQTPSYVGNYELGKLPYEQKIYLGIATDSPISKELVEGKPEALADKRIIGMYYFEKAAGVTTITQNLGIASANDIGFRVKQMSAEASSAVVSLVNTNTFSMSAYYTVNGEQSETITIPAKRYWSQESVKNISLTNLKPAGENIITIHWVNNSYTGLTMDYQF